MIVTLAASCAGHAELPTHECDALTIDVEQVIQKALVAQHGIHLALGLVDICVF